MTYPQYQPTPGGYPMPPQPQQGYQYPPAQQLPANPAPTQFVNPGEAPPPAVPAAPLGFQDPAGGGVAPGARHLEGRTVVIRPRRVDETSNYQGQARPTAYLDLYVIDGGPLVFGDSEDRANPRPPTHRIDTPAYFENMMMGNTMVVSEVRSKLGPNGEATGLALGVVQRGTRGQRPYMLTKCEKDLDGNERPDGAQRRAMAQSIYNRHNGTEQPPWTPPKAVPLAAAVQQQPAAQVNYGPPPQQPAWPQQPHFAQYGNPAAPGGAYGPSTHVPPPPGAPAEHYATYANGPQGVNAPPATQQAAAPGIPPAPGWDPAQWVQFTPEQQQSIWAQASAAATPASAPPVTGPTGAPAAPATPPQAQQGGPGW